MQAPDAQLQKIVEQSSLVSDALDLKVSGPTTQSISSPPVSAHAKAINTQNLIAAGNCKPIRGLTIFGQQEPKDLNINSPLSSSVFRRVSPQTHGSDTESPRITTPIRPVSTQKPQRKSGPSSAIILSPSSAKIRNTNIESPSAKEQTPTTFGPKISNKRPSATSDEHHTPPAKKQALDSNGPSLQMKGELLHRREKARSDSESVNGEIQSFFGPKVAVVGFRDAYPRKSLLTSSPQLSTQVFQARHSHHNPQSSTMSSILKPRLFPRRCAQDSMASHVFQKATYTSRLHLKTVNIRTVCIEQF